MNFEAGVRNVWLLSLPFIALAVLGFLVKPEVAERMSDMSGYSRKEKAFTISASLAPYPLLIGTIWTPFTSSLPLLCLGLALFRFR